MAYICIESSSVFHKNGRKKKDMMMGWWAPEG